MSIASYYKERNKLLTEQKVERTILIIHGISTEDIDKLHHDGYKAWKADRVYAMHNTTSSDELGEEALSMVYQRRNSYDEPYEAIGGFLDSVENDKLFAALKALNSDELELVEACLIEGMNQKEYAAIVGKGQAAISKKLNHIKIKLKAAINN